MPVFTGPELIKLYPYRIELTLAVNEIQSLIAQLVDQFGLFNQVGFHNEVGTTTYTLEHPETNYFITYSVASQWDKNKTCTLFFRNKTDAAFYRLQLS